MCAIIGTWAAILATSRLQMKGTEALAVVNCLTVHIAMYRHLTSSGETNFSGVLPLHMCG